MRLILAAAAARVLAGLLSSAAAAPADVSTCFTPAQSCTGIIVAAIRAARREIRVQAYGFTSAPILNALVAAERRGVDVAVILDKVNDGRRYRGARYVSRAGIPVWIDDEPAIAHNKVIVLDGATVITGSFNFTAAADRRNAENVETITGRDIAARFLANWRLRQAASRHLSAFIAPRRWRISGRRRRWQ